MPRTHLTRRYRFSASHRLHSEQFSDRENQQVYGKCNNPYGHGHNYALEITVNGLVDERTGMVCDLADLDGFVQKEILDRYEHCNLNMLEEFSGHVPTTENLCMEIYRRLRNGFRPAQVEKVRMEETMMNSFEYAGDAELRH